MCRWRLTGRVSIPNHNLTEGLQHLFPTPIWTFSFPRADAVNPILTQGHSRSSPVIPESGQEQCRRVAVPQRPVSLGGARGERNWRLDHGLRASSRRSDGRPERFRGTISAVGWASVCRTGNYNAPHIHPESAWSGVYYVDAGDPDDTMPFSSCLELLDPRSAAGGVNTPGDPFGHPVRIAPRAGLLVLFPSWLTHWVHPHSGRRERIAISFNVSATPESAAATAE